MKDKRMGVFVSILVAVALLVWMVTVGYRRTWVVATAAVLGLAMPLLFHWAASGIPALQIYGWAPTFAADLAGLIVGLGLLFGSLVAGLRRAERKASGKPLQGERVEFVQLDPARVAEAVDAKAKADGVDREVIPGRIAQELSAFEAVVGDWLSGDREIPDTRLAGLAEALDTTPDEIVQSRQIEDGEGKQLQAESRT